MSQDITLAHVFRHEDCWYIFDTVTSQLYECNDVVAAVVPHLDKIDQEHVRKNLVQRWGEEAVAATLLEIDQLRRETGALTPVTLDIQPLSQKRYDPSKYENEIRQLQLTVAEQCNLRCRYCPYTLGRPGARRHQDVFMSRETALAAVDFFLARCSAVDRPGISFYGGEPLLNIPVMHAVIERARSHPAGERIIINVDTNGLIIDEDIARWLVDNRINTQISLDGPAHVHDRYRTALSGCGSHARVIAGIERLLALDPEYHRLLSFNAVLAPPYRVFADVVDYFSSFPPYKKFGIADPPDASLGFADLSYMDFTPVAEMSREPLSVDQVLAPYEVYYKTECAAGRHEQLPPVVRSLFDADVIGYHQRSRSILTSGPFVPTGSCQPGQRKLHVRADGSLLPCERGNDIMFIGHVRHGIDLRAVEALYRSLVDPVAERCRSCWAIRLCKLCFIHLAVSQSEQRRDEAMAIPESFCAQSRLEAEQALRYYLTLERAGGEGLAWLQKITRL